MKPAGMILLLAAGILFGCRSAALLDRHAADIRLLRQLLTYFVTELRASLPLTADLLRNAAEQPAFSGLRFLQDAAADAEHFPACWQHAVDTDPALQAPERAVLETVGQTLGSAALEGQTAALMLCQERLTVLQQDAEAYAKKKGSLCRSLSLLTAVFLVILLF